MYEIHSLNTRILCAITEFYEAKLDYSLDINYSLDISW